jgi:hypothetical protein
MIGMLASSVVDQEFHSRLGQTKDNKIGIHCFSTKTRIIREIRSNRNYSAILAMRVVTIDTGFASFSCGACFILARKKGNRPVLI